MVFNTAGQGRIWLKARRSVAEPSQARCFPVAAAARASPGRALLAALSLSCRLPPTAWPPLAALLPFAAYQVQPDPLLPGRGEEPARASCHPTSTQALPAASCCLPCQGRCTQPARRPDPLAAGNGISTPQKVQTLLAGKTGKLSVRRGKAGIVRLLTTSGSQSAVRPAKQAGQQHAHTWLPGASAERALLLLIEPSFGRSLLPVLLQHLHTFPKFAPTPKPTPVCELHVKPSLDDLLKTCTLPCACATSR